MMQRIRRRQLFIARVVLLLVLIPLLLPTTSAQTDARYFPETGHYLRGAFRYFWETNGGPLGSIHIFGYPITEEYRSGATGRITQYFERARFELIEQNGQYSVALGNLGLEVLAGRSFPAASPIPTTAQKRYIPETRHIIQYGFKEIWETHGAERIFGYPVSDELDEVTADGQLRTVQYFERTRFEYWPNLAPGHRVVISSLGRVLAPADLVAPLPPGVPPGSGVQPPAPPAPQPPADPGGGEVRLPANVNATVDPRIAQPGTTIKFHASGFDANEGVVFWLTTPGDNAMELDERSEARDDGTLSETIEIDTTNFEHGTWAITAQGMDSARTAVGYFHIGSTTPPAAPPAGGGGPTPANTNATISPEVGPPGTAFRFDAGGFDANEDIEFWLTDPNGDADSFDHDAESDNNGALDTVIIESNGFGDGTWAITAHGKESDNQAIAYFRVDSGAAPAPTPEPAPATTATGQCAENAPSPPAEGVNAWMTEEDPELDTTTRLCVQFVIGGKAIPRAEVTAIIRYEERDSDLGPELTNDNGVAELKFKVRDDEDEVDSRAWIDVTVNYGGERYTGRTSFIPRD